MIRPHKFFDQDWLVRRVWEDDGGQLLTTRRALIGAHAPHHREEAGIMRMRIPECVHSFYAPDSDQPWELRTQLFLDFDPVFPGWPPDEEARDAQPKQHRRDFRPGYRIQAQAGRRA